MNRLKDYFEEEEIASWSGLSKYYEQAMNDNQQWIFRGVKNSAWGLQSSLERSILEFSEDNDIKENDPLRLEKTRTILSKGIDGHLVKDLEMGLLRRFKRQCEKYLDRSKPGKLDYMGWFALMQHYGAPTRLQDWTYSFYVSLFFAIDSCESEAVVWALNVNVDWIKESINKAVGKSEAYDSIALDQNALKYGTFENIFFSSPPVDLVCPMNPFNLNERLSIQQGVFLCPGNVSKPFEDNIVGLFSQLQSKDKLKKIIIPYDRKDRNEILKHLYRMNITSATLYPDLQGFSNSLKSLLVFPGMLQP